MTDFKFSKLELKKRSKNSLKKNIPFHQKAEAVVVAPPWRSTPRSLSQLWSHQVRNLPPSKWCRTTIKSHRIRQGRIWWAPIKWCHLWVCQCQLPKKSQVCHQCPNQWTRPAPSSLLLSQIYTIQACIIWILISQFLTRKNQKILQAWWVRWRIRLYRRNSSNNKSMINNIRKLNRMSTHHRPKTCSAAFNKIQIT
jgi:hypothetical protein